MHLVTCPYNVDPSFKKHAIELMLSLRVCRIQSKIVLLLEITLHTLIYTITTHQIHLTPHLRLVHLINLYFFQIVKEQSLSFGLKKTKPEHSSQNASDFHSGLISWWRLTGSNRRPPACKAGALPAELNPHDLIGGSGWNRTNDPRLIKTVL